MYRRTDTDVEISFPWVKSHEYLSRFLRGVQTFERFPLDQTLHLGWLGESAWSNAL